MYEVLGIVIIVLLFDKYLNISNLIFWNIGKVCIFVEFIVKSIIILFFGVVLRWKMWKRFIISGIFRVLIGRLKCLFMAIRVIWLFCFFLVRADIMRVRILVWYRLCIGM